MDAEARNTPLDLRLDFPAPPWLHVFNRRRKGMLKESFKKLEEAILSEAMAHYSDRLVSVVVYGSAARGTQRFDSDIDLLVIARQLPQGRMKRAREFETVEREVEPLLKALQTEGVSTYISAVIKSGKELTRDNVRDAIAALNVDTPAGKIKFDDHNQAYLNGTISTNQNGKPVLKEVYPLTPVDHKGF